MREITIDYNGQKMALSESIKKEALSPEEAKKALDKIYIEATIVQKPFGQTVEEIMIAQGIIKKWGKRDILDVSRAVELTGLNPGVFYTNMYKPNCVIDMALIISMCIGFKLSSVLTQRLLQSAGLDFRLDNPDHIAYLFLLEHCREFDVNKCNEVLEYLGVSKTKRLGSYGRGKDWESMEYQSPDS